MSDYLKSRNEASLFSYLQGNPEGTSRLIGGGECGGKAGGLSLLQEGIEEHFLGDHEALVQVQIPSYLVLGSDIFDKFMKINDLYDFVQAENTDERIFQAFQSCEFPPECVGNLWALISKVKLPLAVRSSSLLEDAKQAPFAGIYQTKMIPNNAPEPRKRFKQLLDAIKFVYASTFYFAAREYRRAIRYTNHDEKMAVIIQDVVGTRFGDRFYPHLSGVARSFNYYPFGRSKPKDGVVSLALGLGKTVVDGSSTWTYSPKAPAASRPFCGIGDMLKNTQLKFWAVNMEPGTGYLPRQEIEHMSFHDLADAEYDDVLTRLVSTYDSSSDVLRPGKSANGPRVLTFAPLLGQGSSLNKVLKELLEIGKKAYGSDVEIEFAMALGPGKTEARLGVVQVRPMVATHEVVEITEKELAKPLVYSKNVLGNGQAKHIRHVLYVKPEVFESKFTTKIAGELRYLNRDCKDMPYVLMGFGRWGSSDPWLGIPVTWGEISNAKAIVEATIDGMRPDPSQGSHFFHNISSVGVSYFSVPNGEAAINWDLLAQQEVVAETNFLRLVRLERALLIKVDGRIGLGVINL
jgi:Pyruvate phosphate dikinase, AMP/ATP-binding domain